MTGCIKTMSQEIIDVILEESETQLLYYLSELRTLKRKEISERSISEHRCLILRIVKNFIDHLDKTDEDYELKIVNKFTELFLNTYCPKCRFVFVDWDGCTDFTCPNGLCCAEFCGFCLSFSKFSGFEKDIHKMGCGINVWRNDTGPYGRVITVENQANIRFVWLKDAINYIGLHNSKDIIRELYKNSNGTLMQDLIFYKYNKELMVFE